MPYIPYDIRAKLDDGSQSPATPGELNYLLTQIVLDYLPGMPRYEDYNAVLGVLAAMQHEIYRRMVAPYEDIKRAENGEIFPQFS